MSGIKYYRLRDGEELPEEFCVVRDVNGEPSEYMWYERMSEFERELWRVLFIQSDWFAGSEYRKLQSENVKLRELVRDMFDGMCDHDRCNICPHWQEEYNGCEYHARMHELGVTDG